MAKDYKHQPAYDTGLLPVGSIHKIHYEQYGKKDGKPVVFLHGGPGGETSIENTAFFNPDVYRVVLLDQRGCGRSQPHAETRENTSQHLVSDIEALREYLGIRKWHMVFGGSWGSTLSLLYAETHPESVGSLVIRGVFTCRQWELDFAYSPTGPAVFFPEAYSKLVDYLPPNERGEIVKAYSKLVLSDDPKVHLPAAKIWNSWELAISKIHVPEEDFEQLENDQWVLPHARMEAYYFLNNAFMEEGQLLKEENVAKIRHIPCGIVQGRLDLLCPPRTALDLHALLPNSQLFLIPKAGHSSKEPGTYSKLIEICDEYAQKDFS